MTGVKRKAKMLHGVTGDDVRVLRLAALVYHYEGNEMRRVGRGKHAAPFHEQAEALDDLANRLAAQIAST